MTFCNRFRGVQRVSLVMCASRPCNRLQYGRSPSYTQHVPPRGPMCTRIDDGIKVPFSRCEIPNVGAAGPHRFGRGWLGTNHPSPLYHDIVEDMTVTINSNCTGLSGRREAWSSDLSLCEEATPPPSSFPSPNTREKPERATELPSDLTQTFTKTNCHGD